MSDFKIERNGNNARIVLSESLTAARLAELREAIKQELGTGALELVFDMARTEAIDSSGLGLLIAAGNSVQAVQGSVKIEGVSGNIMKLLKSMRLVDRLHAGPAVKE